MIDSLLPTRLLASIRANPFCFVSVVSFEERATAWAEAVARSGAQPELAFVLDYETVALPADRDAALRAQCRNRLAEIFDPSRTRRQDGLNAFAANVLTESAEWVLREAAGLPLLVDISCMTRVHLLSFVAALYASPAWAGLVFCYSVPESYGFRPEDRTGWRDVLFVPAGSRWQFKREGQSRGVVLAGHDAERLSVALGELEPASGALIYCGNPKRPDFLRKAREANESTERRLRQLRMPRSSGQPGPSDGWTITSLDVGDFDALSRAIRVQVDEARRDDSPVVLFPFGPKPDSLAAAMLLRQWKVEDAWAVYPVPKSFSTTYSAGVAELQAFEVAEPTGLRAVES